MATRFGAASLAGPVYGPTYARAADASGGGALAADVAFTPASCTAGLQLVFADNRTFACPVGASPTAPNISDCAWFALQGRDAGWVNATAVAVLNATAVRLSAESGGADDVVIATAFGQASWPVTVLFSGPLPVVPWNTTL